MEETKCFDLSKSGKISIVIPFNCMNMKMNQDWRRLGIISIASVLAQSYTNWECFVIYSSNEGIDDIKRCFNDNRITFIPDPFRGDHAYNARVLGASMSTGDWIYFLDADGMIYPNFMSKLMMYYEQKPYDYALLANDSNCHELRTHISVDQTREENIHTMCSFVSREVYDTIGGWVNGGAASDSNYAYKIIEYISSFRGRSRILIVNELLNFVWTRHWYGGNGFFEVYDKNSIIR